MPKSIRRDLSIRIGFVIFLISIVIGVSYYTYSINQQKTDFVDSIDQQAKRIADTFTLQLWLFDLTTTRELCKLFTESSEVNGLRLLDQNKEIIFEKEVPVNKKDIIPVSMELRHDTGTVVGYLEIFYANTDWELQRKNILFVCLYMVLGSTIGSFILINILLKNYLTKPLSDLQKDMLLLAQGNFQQSDLTNQKAEIQSIIDAFNDLTVRLRERDTALYEANKIINRSPAVAFLWTNDTNLSVEFVSENVVNLTGYSPQDFLEGRVLYREIIHEDDVKIFIGEVAGSFQGKGRQASTNKTYRLITKGGIVKWVRDQSYIRKDSHGKVIYLGGIVYDITEEVKLTERLQQAQKMEAIGTLAGGIAHDFNNILSAIIGYSELIQDEVPADSTVGKDIASILVSGERAADLVKQILTFSRKAETKKQPLRPHLIVKEALKMLRATLPATISIKESIDPDCGVILADPTNIHQITVNLCTNALHAMTDQKGTLSVSLQHQELSAAEIGEEALSPGPFVVITVSDTGCGMEKTTIERIFDPYFTTKERGKGTGLGLAVIHGIVHDAQGFIRVESTLGEGSSFIVYLPALHEKSATGQNSDNKASLQRGSEHILVVDDEPFLVRATQRQLGNLGYTVTATTDSKEALEKIKTAPEQFDLLITDQTMPGLTGAELALAVKEIKPGLPIILCTGHSDLISEEKAFELGIKKYVLKPVIGDALFQAIREILDEK